MSLAGILAGLFVLLAVYCALDPFKHSPISANPDFVAYEIEIAPWSEIPTVKDTQNLLQKAEVKFLNQVDGPESVAFDPLGRGPYTGVADGRVVFWNGESWVDFAYTSPHWSPDLCLNYSKKEHEHVCGRPLGLRFYEKTGDLYICDPYFGLMKVGPEGGLATSLATEAEGVPFQFTNDLDIDDEGNVYFTESSTKYKRSEYMQILFSGEKTGRVMKYNPTTKETIVLVRNIQFANGISLSKDRSFFVYSELCAGRLMRHWLKGEKSGISDVFAILPGMPDNVRTNDKGEFWVGVHSRISRYQYTLAHHPGLRNLMLKLPIPPKVGNMLKGNDRGIGIVMKYSPDGKLLQLLEDSEGKVVSMVSEAREIDGKLWIGSVVRPFIAVYQLE